ncbi:MAG: serine/threonine protein kinase [Deltaproteobacteria bacterium]|nr:serine/threonine protein kinase [Deltaproteobacteria bacterium]
MKSGAPSERNIGRYEVLIELARGGMAELCLGRLHGAGGFAKLVAIKRILPHLADDEQFRDMFLEEGRIASRLSHPNVCQVFELDNSDGELFLAMEYLDGVGWDQLLAATKLGSRAGPPLGLAAGVLAQAAEGLHYAHTLHDVEGNPTPVVHRDVSPQNLFVTLDGVCKVLDFGVSKMMTDGPRTKSGVVKGKLPYMAPEQIRGESVDARTDVFSLGVCLWEALAGERLYDRSTDFLVWKAITEEDAPPLVTRWPACPPAISELARQALARDPAARFASARAFAEALRDTVPAMASSARIGDAVRTSCGEKIAARSKRVATAISSRRSGPIADLEPSSSAAATLQSGRSAALTLDDKPRVTRDAEDDLRDPAVTTDLRSGSKESADVQLRDHSVVADRASDATSDELGTSRSVGVDAQLQAITRHRRLGLILGGLAAAAVIVTVIVVATRSSPSPAPQSPSPIPPIATPEPRPVATPDAAVAVVEQVAPADAAPAKPDRKPPDPKPDPKKPEPKKPEPKKLDPKKPTPRPDPKLAPEVPFVASEPGSLSVASDPYAEIFIDGKRLNYTPLFRVAVPAGKHTLRAVRSDGKEQTLVFEVAPGKERNLGKLAW